jgi:hypothetical protein
VERPGKILHIIMMAFQSAVEYSWFPAADIVDSIVANNSQTVYCPGQLYMFGNSALPLTQHFANIVWEFDSRVQIPLPLIRGSASDLFSSVSR